MSVMLTVFSLISNNFVKSMLMLVMLMVFSLISNNVAKSVHHVGYADGLLSDSVAHPECAKGGGVSYILAEAKGFSFSLFKKRHENSIFSPIKGGGVCRVRPMLDPPL